ncbi:MAG TPA: D-alanyl-D-alanine carboxypeptidase family protein [Candidatus Competibacteraceae bacterium]|nr:D-alanyl-D-alanine carboxypeptidase family protein [Candidatus Competibacteraceae bacterium]
MLRLRLYLLILLALLLPAFAARAAALLDLAGAEALPPPPKVDARAWLLMEARTGQVLAAGQPDQRLPQASLTKLMTAYVVLRAAKAGQIRLDDPVTIGDKAWRTGGSRIYLNKGDQVPVETLLRGLLANSGNDAAVALAEHLGGSLEGFAALMNQAAAQLGLSNSHFVTPHGLHHPDHYTSARDLGILARAIILEFPEHYPLFGLKSFTYGKVTQRNRNRLLWREDSAVDGMKTGFTVPARYCVVNSAQRGELRLISIVLGAPNPQVRFENSAALLDYGFSHYRLDTLVAPAQPLTEVRVWGATAKRLPLGLTEPLYLLRVRAPSEPVRLEFEAPEFELNGTLSVGDAYGRLRAYLGQKLIHQQSLYALQPLQESGFFARAADAAQRLWEEWFN